MAKRSHATAAPSRTDSHPLRLIRPSRLAELLDVNPSTIWRWRKAGILPPPSRVGGVEGWTEPVIQELLDQRREEASQ